MSAEKSPREALLSKAKLAEQIERYDSMYYFRSIVNVVHFILTIHSYDRYG